MIYFESNEQKYGISFSYFYPHRTSKKPSTLCKIYAIGADGRPVKTISKNVLEKTEEITVVVAVGIANCYHKDQFCKESGREIALNRAIESAYINRFNSQYKPIMTPSDKRKVKIAYHSR